MRPRAVTVNTHATRQSGARPVQIQTFDYWQWIDTILGQQYTDISTLPYIFKYISGLKYTKIMNRSLDICKRILGLVLPRRPQGMYEYSLS